MLNGGTEEDAPVGALVVFDTNVTTTKLELGIADDVEFIDTGGREEDAAVGNLVVELLEGVGTPEDEPKGCVKELGVVTEVLALTETGGVTTVAVSITKVVLCDGVGVGLPLPPVPDRVEFERIDDD